MMCMVLRLTRPQQKNVVNALKSDWGGQCDSCGGHVEAFSPVHFSLSSAVWRMYACVWTNIIVKSNIYEACTWILWIWWGLLSELGTAGVVFHSAATTARHELEERFYQIKTELLKRSTVVTFCYSVLVREYFFIWDYFISKMKVPLLFFLTVFYTNHCQDQDFYRLLGNQYIRSHSRYFMWSLPGFDPNICLSVHVCLLSLPLIIQ